MRILSGIQPSGSLHLGNYFGMMKKMIEYQEQEELFCFIANYHAMTSLGDGKALAKGTLEAAANFLALGMDPEKSTFWVQSDLPEVQELTWILSNFTPMGLLERCHSYKDKITKGIAPNHGLFAYPVLMTADILLFQSERVPVGKDQKQHLEVARDIAIKANNHFGELFVVPEAEIDDEVATVPGLDGQKMSKSYGNTIDLFLEEKALRKQVMRIVTDPTPVEDPKDPDQAATSSRSTGCFWTRNGSRRCGNATWRGGWATARSSRSCSRRYAISSPPMPTGAGNCWPIRRASAPSSRRGRRRPATWPARRCARCARRRGWFTKPPCTAAARLAY